MLTIRPPPCARICGTTARQVEEHAEHVDVHDLAPLVDRDLLERPHGQRRVDAGVVDEHVDAPAALDRSRRPCAPRRPRRTTSTVRPTPSAEARPPPPRRRCRSAMTIRAPSAARPLGDRAADALRAAGDDRDLAVERRSPAPASRASAARMRVCLRVDQRPDLGQEGLPALVGLQLRAPLARGPRRTRSPTGARSMLSGADARRCTSRPGCRGAPAGWRCPPRCRGARPRAACP